MAICKCRVRPRQGNFEVGKYYTWYYAVTKTQLKPKSVRDADKENFQFLPGEYSYYFKDIEFAGTNIAIYIDRKKELLFVPEFRYEEGFGVSLSYFNRLPVPYTEESIGLEFKKVWEEYKDHPVVNKKEREEAVPYFKLATKGKGWRAFMSGRWLVNVQFVPSENEMMFTYWYKKGYYFGLDASDPEIERVLPMSASCEEIGRTVLTLFEEAGII